MRCFYKYMPILPVAFLVLMSCQQNKPASADTPNKGTDTTGAPELTLLNKKVDAGEVIKDSSVIGKYYFINSGKKKLVVDYVNPDCSCTGFYLTKKEVEPGDSSCLVLKMSTKNKEGDIHINATISANTPTRLYHVSLFAKVI